MNDYCEGMKSEDAGPVLRKLTEQMVQEAWSEAVPVERFDQDYALLVFPADSGWAVGMRIEFSEETWTIAEIVTMPGDSAQGLPALDSQDVRSYLDRAVIEAREKRSQMLSRLENIRRHADFIQSRFESWRDKTAPRGNAEYAALAAKYAEQVREGNTKVTAALAEQVNMSPAVMAQRIKEARRRLLLTRGEQGRASGALTPLGALYTDPDFPGMRTLWKSGKTMREIAEQYGIDELSVWTGMQEERSGDGVHVPLDEFMAHSDRGLSKWP